VPPAPVVAPMLNNTEESQRIAVIAAIESQKETETSKNPKELQTMSFHGSK